MLRRGTLGNLAAVLLKRPAVSGLQQFIILFQDGKSQA